MYKNLDEPIEPLSIRIANVLMGIERLIAWCLVITSGLWGVFAVAAWVSATFSSGLTQSAKDATLHDAGQWAGGAICLLIVCAISATIFQTIDYLITGRKHK